MSCAGNVTLTKKDTLYTIYNNKGYCKALFYSECIFLDIVTSLPWIFFYHAKKEIDSRTLEYITQMEA